MSVAVRYTGLAELRAELRKLEDPRYWGREFRRAGKEAAGLVAEEAKRRAPKGPTGHLRASIRPLASNTRSQVAAGKSNVPYAGVIEFGWHGVDRKGRRHNVPAEPFLYPALEALQDEVAGFYLRAVDRLAARAFPG